MKKESEIFSEWNYYSGLEMGKISTIKRFSELLPHQQKYVLRQYNITINQIIFDIK